MLISKNVVNTSEVDEFAKKRGYNLPSDLDKFLKTYNGGNTPNTSVKTSNVSSDVRAFYGVGMDLVYSLNKVQVIDKNEIIYLPVAVDSFGNVFVVDITSNTGVFFVNHEKNRELEQVAESFKAFIQLCKSEPIKEFSRKTPKEREELLISKGKGANITDGLRKMWQDEYDKYKGMIQEEVKF